MRTFTPLQCENCISFDPAKCSCREQSSSLFGGSISPMHLACSKYLSLSTVYAPKKQNQEMAQGAHDGRYER